MNARVCVRVQTHGHAHVHTITRTHRAHTGPTREHSVTGLWPAGRGWELLQRAGSWRVPSRLVGIAFGRDFIMKWTSASGMGTCVHSAGAPWACGPLPADCASPHVEC